MQIFTKKSYFNYNKYDDKSLINLAKNGNTIARDFLINRYKRIVKYKARVYFLIGAETEDIIQEGMIGLYKAFQNYDDRKLASFRVFAEICISRQIKTAIKRASRKKHKPLNYGISLSQAIADTKYCDNRTLWDIVGDIHINDPVQVFLDREKYRELTIKINTILSNLERKVLEAYIEGKSYRDIAQEIRKNYKCVDNSLQRIKKKIDFVLN